MWLDRLVVAWLFTEKSTAYRISKLGKTSCKTKNVVTAPRRRFLNKLRILVIKCTKKTHVFLPESKFKSNISNGTHKSASLISVNKTAGK